MNLFNTPICLILFKRPDSTSKVLNAIRAVKPKQLYIIADGPRSQIPGEIDQCLATQRLLDDVDWDCEVIVNRSVLNQGGRQRIISGLNWLFQQVEQAIIVEDDCLPDPSFFYFCAELLARYADEPQVTSISGNNFQLGHVTSPYSYGFSRYPSIWGWATWRRAWANYDPTMQQWPQLRDSGELATFLPDAPTVASWTHVFELAHQGLTAWDYPWIFSCFRQRGLTIVPSENLVANIGFDSTASGGFDLLPESFIHLLAEMPCHAIAFPLQHPSVIAPDPDGDRFTQILVQDLYWQTERGQCQLRHEIAQRWLQWPDGMWHQDYTLACVNHVLKSHLRGEWMLTADQALIDDLKTQLAEAGESTTQLKSLLVAMLYLHPHQLPRFFNPEVLPEWVLENYLNFMLTPPTLFKGLGEAEDYAQFMQRWIGFLHDNIMQKPESPLWQKVAAHFAQKSDLMMIYFNDLNLKELYQQRAAILEFALKQQGCELEYDFPERSPERTKIRLGVLAHHFSVQTETYTTLPVYKHLNRDQFEVILFSIEVTNHRLERYCGGHADAFIKLPESLSEQVQLMREADLDILWIGTNVTLWASPITQLACHRLARVQVTSTSSCTTTGLSHISHYISGDLTEHPAAQAQYTETLICLSGPAHTHDFGTEEQLVPSIQVSRAALNIPEAAVVYVSGANFFKITPELEETWARILAAVPDARLMLYPFNQNWSETYPVQSFQRRITATLERYQVNPERLLLLPPVPNRADVEQRLKIADVYLDSFPFAGVNSLVDPLELGLPTIVQDGHQFRSRMGAAFLRDLAIPELITDSSDAYLNCAIALGTQPKLRQELRDRILANMPTCRFRDSRQYSAQVEAVLQDLFHKFLRTELAETLRLQTYNWVIFPDWTQDEEVIGMEIANVIFELASHPTRQETTLLIDLQGAVSEDVNLLISGIAMSLMMEAELDLAQGPELSLVETLTPMQWRALQPVVQWLEIEHQNQTGVTQIFQLE